MSRYDLETTLQLSYEDDVEVLIEFEVMSWGRPGVRPSLHHPGDPPEPPEFEVINIVRTDNGNDIIKTLTDDEWDKIHDLIYERIYEIEEDRSYGPED